MKKILTVIIIFCALSAFSQEKKKVAVLQPYDKDKKVETAYKNLIRISINEKISESDKYVSVDMALVDKIVTPENYSSRGFVQETEKQKLIDNGVSYILHITVYLYMEHIVICSSMIDINTGKVIPELIGGQLINKDEASVKEACEYLSKIMFEIIEDDGSFDPNIK